MLSITVLREQIPWLWRDFMLIYCITILLIHRCTSALALPDSIVLNWVHQENNPKRQIIWVSSHSNNPGSPAATCLELHQRSFPLSPLRELVNITEYNVGRKQMMKGKYEFQVEFFLISAFVSLFSGKQCLELGVSGLHCFSSWGIWGEQRLFSHSLTQDVTPPPRRER